jgi:hypothetical protein
MLEETNQRLRESFNGDEEEPAYQALQVGEDLLDFSLAVSTAKIKRDGNPKQDRKALRHLGELVEAEGGATAAAFLQHCVAELLAGAVEAHRDEILAVDQRAREKVPVSQEDLDFATEVSETLLDTEDGSLMVTLGVFTHRAISLASFGRAAGLRMFEPVEHLDWRDWVTVDDIRWDGPLHLGVAPRWDQAAENYALVVDAA